MTKIHHRIDRDVGPMNGTFFFSRLEQSENKEIWLLVTANQVRINRRASWDMEIEDFFEIIWRWVTLGY